MKDGIIASRIAAHAADIANGVKGAIDWDHEMSKARGELNWERMFELAIDPEKAREYRKSSSPENEEVCTMCGDLCPIKRGKDLKNA